LPSFSTSLEDTLHRALGFANERGHEYATLEHLLLALVDDEDAAGVMKACDVDLGELKSTLTAFVDAELGIWPSMIMKKPSRPPASSASSSAPSSTFRIVRPRRSDGRQRAGGDLCRARKPRRLLPAEQDMTRYDAVNYISHGIAKRPAPVNRAAARRRWKRKGEDAKRKNEALSKPIASI
jgi:ATP-dependent Clp protease ATP-binding subunit ClpA